MTNFRGFFFLFLKEYLKVHENDHHYNIIIPIYQILNQIHNFIGHHRLLF